MSAKSLSKVTPKYRCMVSGEKRMSPCSGCVNPKGCISREMQYKENITMNKKAIVKIDADGDVVKCAKNLSAAKCGFKPGSKVCGACGAMAVSVKEADGLFDDDFFEDDDVEMSEKGGYGAKRPKGSNDIVTQMARASMKEDGEMDDEMMDEAEDVEEDVEGMRDRRAKARKRRMMSMGMKSEDWDDDAFICALERKVYPGTSGPCEGCVGGCISEGELPGLLEIEGLAEEMFGGKVLDSGYSDVTDEFVVDVERKDGRIVEVFLDGPTAEVTQWLLLDDDILEEKSALQGTAVVSFDEAANIAVKSIEGDVVTVEPEIFEGFDSYVVEIEGVDGKSYDVYVSLDGEVLGYDEYDADEAEDIEAEAAEIALKRAYSEETRMQMAEDGMALPDGSYPIKDEADLQNAIQAYGRAKDKEKAKAHIMKRARELDREDMIPEKWMSKSDDLGYSDEDAEFAELELKRTYTDDERDKMAEAGHALPDGSFPIKDQEDLANAIQAYGRAKDKDLAKAHIMKRALDLKLEDMIPMSWIPKKIRDQYENEGKKDDSNAFLASLMEFELLTAQVDSKDSYN